MMRGFIVPFEFVGDITGIDGKNIIQAIFYCN